jgi:hypothetical protein
LTGQTALRSQRLGNAVGQAWIGVIQGLVGMHGRDHGADADVLLGPPQSRQAITAGMGNSKNNSLPSHY